MKNKRGTILMVLGVLLIASALLLVVHNQREGLEAQKASGEILTELQEAEPVAEKSVLVDGRACIGILTIPSLDLSLPVLRDWSYPNLKLAPCLYAGSVADHNLVIMAHNYRAHFGRLTDLLPGDPVIFEDASKKKTVFQVAGIETLKPDQVEEMKEGNYPLTLFTCTYGGRTRIVVRCTMDYDASMHP